MAKQSNIASIILIVLAIGNIAICAHGHGKEKNEQHSQRCQEQIEKQQQQLSSCQQYLIDGSRTTTSSSTSSMEFIKINEGKWREEFPKCCEQLEQLDSRCRCQAISQIVEKLQSGRRELEGVEMKEMLETAQSLPNLCRLKPKSCNSAAESAAF